MLKFQMGLVILFIGCVALSWAWTVDSIHGYDGRCRTIWTTMA